MMRRSLRLAGGILAAVALGLLALLAIQNSSPYQAAAMNLAPMRDTSRHSDALATTDAASAYFVVGFAPEHWTFTILLTDSAKIQDARDIVNGVQTDRVSVMGTIVKAPAPYNPLWSYHLDPASIEFFQFAVEVCDAHPQYVEQHLQEACGAFLPHCVWCPYSSVIVAEMHLRELFLPIVMR
jgi:hypothetical protein